jgi:hypothetical protein
MAVTAVVGSLIAGESALIAMSTMTRRANVESYSMVRSGPNATWPREIPIVDHPRAFAYDQQRATGCNEVADLWHQFHDTAEAPRGRDQRSGIDREDDARLAGVRNRAPPRQRSRAQARQVWLRSGRFRVDVGEHFQPLFRHASDDAERAQQAGRVVDQEQEGDDGDETPEGGDANDETRDCLRPVVRTEAHHEPVSEQRG